MQFAELLRKYMSDYGYTPGHLARLSGVPKMTLVHWLNGDVKKPRLALEVVRLASALRLSKAEADDLLQAAGFGSVYRVYTSLANEADKVLFANWLEKNGQYEHGAPFQAVPRPGVFVGREALLKHLSQQLTASTHERLYALVGMAGVGKTALAAELAYRLRFQFPDGVLWMRLDGSDPMSILQLFAIAYGQDVSPFGDIQSRSQAVRMLLAGKRALMVLDNAQFSEQIRSLLPPTGPCAVLVTTRRHDMAVLRGSSRFMVEPFDEQGEESVALFSQILGWDRVQAEREALLQIARLLGHLPLALEIAAYRLADEPGLGTTKFLAMLRTEKKQLAELAYGQETVRAAFESSYALLSPAQQSFFAALGQLPERAFQVKAAAAAANLATEVADQLLRQLYALSLVHQGRNGRYRLLPLLHQFAQEKCQAF